VVDPIDGTRGFIAGNDQWVVSIAIVEDGAPKLGVLFNPVRGEMYFAQSGKGAFKETANGDVERLKPSGKDEPEGALIACPASIKPAGRAFPFDRADHIASLALRIAQVAEGSLDGCIAKGGARHWDIAAADLIASETGVPLGYTDGPLMRYDLEAIRHPVFLCASPALNKALIALI
jgi:myo-inositol-1(or 4)-monophosphatase